jgi:hypothetical protein
LKSYTTHGFTNFIIGDKLTGVSTILLKPP